MIRKILSAPSIRLNTLVVLEIVMLLVVSLGGLFYFTRKALVEESKMDAEQRLDGTVQHIDNVLMSIEQSAGNVYQDLLSHLDQPDRMVDYCSRLVECNPYIYGCVIAFSPNYYSGREQFIAYVHRKTYNSPELIKSDTSVNYPYTQQNWFTETMKTCHSAWVDPGQNDGNRLEPIISFCLPIRDYNGECVGVIGVGLSINLLSQIVLETKPSPNSYSILLAHDGSYIIHPNREKLGGRNVFSQPDIEESPSALEAVKAMMRGETGNMSFRMNDFTWYLFYKPFLRSNLPGRTTNTLKWSIATVYPKDDIFGEYNYLVFHVLGIVLIALLVFYVLCRKAIRKQLKPLIYLTESAERISQGHYDETIPNVNRDDEVGVFYKHFQVMQKALEADIAKREQQKTIMHARHEELQKIHQQIEEDKQVKATFLHNVTNRMIAPAESISESVTTLCDHFQEITLPEANQEIKNIKQQSETILELLSHKFDVSSEREAGKEDNHE